MTTRAGDLLWVFLAWDDLDADFRRFYRIDGIGDGDYGDLTGPRFLALADRVVSYEGATFKTLMRLHQERQKQAAEEQQIKENAAKIRKMSDIIEFG